MESAVVKIQSTFRGKKIRSKLGTKGADETKPAAAAAAATSTSTPANKQLEEKKKQEELNKKVATMQVNDNSDSSQQAKELAENVSKSGQS